MSLSGITPEQDVHILINWLPETLDVFSFILLIVTSFFTSFLTAAVGIGGGLALMAVMAQMLPVAVLVPIHGVVQLGSNTGRAMVMRAHINWRMFGWFLGGAAVGALVGGQLVVTLPGPLLQGMLGLFVLYAVWGPKPGWAKGEHQNRVLMAGGGLSTLASMFIGASGPLVAAILKPFGLKRQEQVGTFAALMTAQHLLKVLVFGALGFAFHDYIVLMLLMIGAGFLGTLVGRAALNRLSEAHFSRLFGWALSVLALRLIWRAVAA